MKVALLLALFSASAIAQISVASTQSACGAVDTEFKVKTTASPQALQEPASDKALVYVVEEQKFKAVRDVTARVGLDGSWVGANRGNSYLFFVISPGEHHLCADWVSQFLPGGRAVSLSSLKADADNVYYFRVRTTGGPGSALQNSGGLQIADSASIDLVQVDPDEGRMLVASSALSVSHPKK